MYVKINNIYVKNKMSVFNRKSRQRFAKPATVNNAKRTLNNLVLPIIYEDKTLKI